MNRRPIRQRVFLLIAAGLLCFSLSLFATDYEGPPPTTPDYGAEWTGPIQANYPGIFQTRESDILYASNGSFYTCTRGSYRNDQGEYVIAMALSRFDRYGNCLVRDRIIFDRTTLELEFHLYENSLGEFWITGIGDYFNFITLQFNEDCDLVLPSGFRNPMPDTLLHPYFSVAPITDPDGYPTIWCLKRLGPYEYVFTKYKFTHDFSEMIEEVEYPDILATENGGAVVKGPGDTLHVIYSRQVGIYPDHCIPVFYAKIGFNGEVYYGPVTHTDTTTYYNEVIGYGVGNISIDNQNNVYINFLRYVSRTDRRTFLRIYRNDGEVVDRDFGETLGLLTGAGHASVLDCMGRIHLFWEMDNGGYFSEIAHAAVEDGDTAWVIEPHFLLIQGLISNDYKNAVSLPNEYRIGFLATTRIYDDDRDGTTSMWILGSPEEPDTNESHSFLNSGHPVNSPLFPPEIYPNPFNSSTTLRYYSHHSGTALISIYDLLGREVAVLSNQAVTSGWHTIPFHCRSGTLPSGTYFMKIDLPEASPIIRQLVYTK